LYKLAIIGYPLSHSLSNVMHQAAFKACGLEGCYDVLETKPEDLVSVVKRLKSQGYNGFNVTIPHKVPITLFLEQFDDFSNLAGAVNTVKILDDKTLYGYNTDVYGFINALPKDINLSGEKVAIIGTGGASRAVCTGLSSLGVSKIDLFTRNVANSHETVSGFRSKFKNVEVNLYQTEMLKTLEEYKVVVNTTPLGMKSFASGISPLKDEIVKTLPDDGVMYDIVYNPIKTEFIKQAIKFNKKYVTGIDMLALQGARAFEIWTGVEVDVNVMKVAVLENLLRFYP